MTATLAAPSTTTAAPLPAEGASVHLTPGRGASPTSAQVVAWEGGEALLVAAGPVPVPGSVQLRLLDEDGVAWSAAGIARSSIIPGAVAVELVAPLAPAARRASFRSAVRHPRVRLRSERRSLDLQAVDLSSTGMRAAGTGEPPVVGLRVRVFAEGPLNVGLRPIPAEVVRVERGAFGRYEVAVRFDTAAPADLRAVLAWRAWAWS